MASENELSYDGMGFGKGLDFNFEEETPKDFSEMSKREIITDATKGGVRGLGKSLGSGTKWRDAIINELPGPFKETWNAYDETSRDLGSLYDQAEKDVKPVLGQIANSLDSMVPDSFERTKKVTGFLKEKFYTAPGGGRLTPEQIQNQATETMLSEVFKGLEAARQEPEPDENGKGSKKLVKAAATEQIEKDRFEASASLFASIDSNVRKLSLYQERVGMAVERKGLELSFRKYTLLADLVQRFQSSEVRQTDQLKVLIHHSTLPEYKKLHMSDRFKDSAKRRLTDGVHNKMFGEGSLLAGARKKISSDIKEGMGKFRSALEMGLMGIDEAKNAKDLIKDTGSTVPGAFGDFAGSWVGDTIREKFLKKIMPEFANDKELQKFGYKMGTAALNPRYGIDQVAESEKFKELEGGRFGSKFTGAMGYFKDLFKPQKGRTDLEGGASFKGMLEPENFTKRLNVVQTEVVPGYLARILREVTMFRTGAETPLLMFDPMTGAFKDSTSIKDGLSKLIDKSFENNGGVRSIKELSETMAKDMELEEPEANEALIKLITSLMRSSDPLEAKTIERSTAYEKATPVQKAIYDKILGKLEGDTHEKAKTIYNYERGMGDVRRNLDSGGAMVQEFVDAGLKDQLIDLGIITKDEDGKLSLSEKAVQDRIEKAAVQPSDVNLKQNFKPISGKKALSGIKNLPISAWEYINKKRGKGQKIGAMAQDLNKQLGEEVAPGGKKVDLVSANGANMAAIQELSRNQDKLKEELLGDDKPGSEKARGSAKNTDGKLKTQLDYLKAINANIQAMHETLKTKNFLSGLPGIDFSQFKMPDMDLKGVKDKAKKLADPLIATGNRYFDTLQSLIQTAVKDAGEGLMKGYGKFKEHIFTPGKEGVQKLWADNKDHLKEKGKRYTKNVYEAGKETLFKHVPETIKSTIAGLKNIKETAKRLINGPVDVYLKGNPSPVLLASRMRAGAYASSKNGKIIRGVDDLLAESCDILDVAKNSEMALRWTDAADGLFDQHGHPLRTTGGLLVGAVLGAGMWAGKKIAGAVKSFNDSPSFMPKVKEMLSGMKDSISSKFKNFSGVSFHDVRQLTILAQIRDLTAIGKKRMFLDHVYNRDLKDEKHLSGKAFMGLLFGNTALKSLKEGLDGLLPTATAPEPSNPSSFDAADKDTPQSGSIDKLLKGFKDLRDSLKNKPWFQKTKGALSGLFNHRKKKKPTKPGQTDNLLTHGPGDKPLGLGSDIPSPTGPLPGSPGGLKGKFKGWFQKGKDFWKNKKQTTDVSDVLDARPDYVAKASPLAARNKGAEDVVSRPVGGAKGTGTDHTKEAGGLKKMLLDVLRSLGKAPVVQGAGDAKAAGFVPAATPEVSPASAKPDDEKTPTAPVKGLLGNVAKHLGASALSSYDDSTIGSLTQILSGKKLSEFGAEQLQKLTQKMGTKALETAGQKLSNKPTTTGTSLTGIEAKPMAPSIPQSSPILALPAPPPPAAPGPVMKAIPTSWVPSQKSLVPTNSRAMALPASSVVRDTVENTLPTLAPTAKGALTVGRGMLGKLAGKMGGKGEMITNALSMAGDAVGSVGSAAGEALKSLFGGPTPVKIDESNEGTALSKVQNRRSTVRDLGDGSKGKPTVSDRDGDGNRDGGSTEQLRRFEEDDKARKEREAAKANEAAKNAQADSLRYKSTENQVDVLLKSTEGFLNSLKENAAGLFEMGKGVLDMIPGMGKMASIAWAGLKAAGSGLGRAATWGGSKLISGGAGIFNAGRAAYAAGGVLGVAKTALGAARGAASVARVAAMATGTTGGTIVAAGIGVLQAGLGLLLSPLAIKAAVVAGVGYGLYKGYKYFTRNSLNDFEKLRALQYGLNKDSKDLHKAMELEGYFLDGRLTYSNGQANFNAQKVKAEDIMGILDIDKNDAERAEKLKVWLSERFKPFFLNHVNAMFLADPKLKLTDVKKLEPEKLKIYLEKAQMLDGPYGVTDSPFESQESMNNTKEDIPKLIELLKNKKENKKGGILQTVNSTLTFGVAGVMLAKLPWVGDKLKTLGKGIGGIAKFVGNALVWGAKKVASNPMAALTKTRIAAMAFGGISGNAVAAGVGILQGGIALLSSPFVIKAAVVAGIGYGLYKGYKYFTRNSLNDYEKLRAIQYGLTKDSKDLYRVMELEGYFLDGRVEYSNKVASINMRKVNAEDILDIMGVGKDDKKRAVELSTWLTERFKPFFLNHLSALFQADPKAKLSEIEKVDFEVLNKYLDKAQFLDGPYAVAASPFTTQEAMINTKEDIPKLIEVLRLTKKKKEKVTNTGSLKDDVAANLPALKNLQDKKREQAEQARKNVAGVQDTLDGKKKAQEKSDATKPPNGPKVPDLDAKNKSIPDNLKGDDGDKKPASVGNVQGTFASKEGQAAATTANLTKAKGPLAPAKDGEAHIAFSKGTNIEQINPSMKTKLLGMAADYGLTTGKKMLLTDGFRTYDQQADIYKRMPDRAAKPGSSMHEKGLAVDIDPKITSELEKLGLMRKYGFTRPIGGETWHTEPAGIQQDWDRAKKDPAWATQQIEASPGRGGGGYGSVSGSVLKKRNAAAAKAAWEATSSKEVENKPKEEKLASATSSVVGGTAPTTGGTESGVANGKAPSATDKNPKTDKTAKGLADSGTDSKAVSVPGAEGEPTPSGSGKETILKTKKGYTAEFGSKAANDPSMVGNASLKGGTDRDTGKPSVEKTKEIVKKAAVRANMDPPTLQLFAAAESAMGQNQNGGGAAQGPFQFMPDTWKETLNRYGKKYQLDPSTPPTDTHGSALMAAEYLNQNKKLIQKQKTPADFIDYYLSHMLGGGGVQTFLKIPAGESAAAKLPGAAMNNYNVFFKDGKKMQQPMTAGEVREKLAAKFNKLSQDFGIGMQVTPGKLGPENKPTATANGVGGSGAIAANDSMMASNTKDSFKKPGDTLKTTGPVGLEGSSMGPTKTETMTASYAPPVKDTLNQPASIDRPKAPETLRGNADVASGMASILERGLVVEEKLLNAVQNDMVPVLRRMQETLEKIYTEGKSDLKGKNGESSPAEAGAASSLQASRSPNNMSSTPSALDRRRRYG